MSMQVWHLEVDTPRNPHRVSPGDPVELIAGTWPISAGQSVWAKLSNLGRPRSPE